MKSAALALLLAAMSLPRGGETKKIDFDDHESGKPPNGFSFGLTAKNGLPGEWIVKEDAAMRDRGKFLAQVNADGTRARFPVAVLDAVWSRDVDARVLIRPVSGRVDQAGGLVWRYQNEDNYYVVRANALEDNVVLYKVQDGRRTDLPLKGEGRTYGKNVDVPSHQWSELRVAVRGDLFEVYFNGLKLYEVEDRTFAGAGNVGVWTKADSVTYFDDLVIVTK